MNSFKHSICAATSLASLVAMGAMSEAYAQIDEIVVTAQKREQSLTEVPISITVLNGEQLQNSNLSTVIDLPQMVPGLRIDLAGAFAQPTIRGVGSAIAAAGFNSNIATYVDGFYAPSQLTTDMKLLSLANVQVAKGPQGTLYGRNATGGAILLTSREPLLDEPVLEVNTTYARFNRREVSAYGSYALTDNLAVDVTGFYEAGKGFVDNIYTGADDDNAFESWALRSSALFEPTDWATFKFAYSHSDRDDPSPLTTGSYNGLSAGTALNSFFPGAYVVASDFAEVSNDGKTGFVSESDGFHFTAEFDLGWATLKSLTMYRDEESLSTLDLDGAGSAFGPLFNVEFAIENQTITQEINLSGTFKDRFEWLLGGYYLNFDEDFSRFTAEAPGFGLLMPTDLYNVGATNIAYAAFADATLEFVDNWFVTGGIRYNVDATDGFFDVRPIGSALLMVPPGRTDASEWFHDVTVRGILRWEPTETSSIYFSYSEGYKAGALTPSAFTTTPTEPEEIKAYELGYKFAGNRNRLEAAVFYYDYSEIQLAQYNGLQALVNNAAEATVVGGEIQWNSSLTDNLSVNVGLSYTDSEYDEFPAAQAFVQDLNPLSPTFSTFLNPVVGASGNDIQRAPDFTGNVGINYVRDIWCGSIEANANYYYTTKIYFDPVNQFEQDAYGIMNLRLAWTDPSEHWTIAAFGKNVFNEKYLNQVLPGAVAVQQTFGEPATGGLTISFKY